MFEIMKKITEQMVEERQSKHFKEYRMLCDSLIAYFNDQAVFGNGIIRCHNMTFGNIEFLRRFIGDEKELVYVITQNSLSNRMYETYKYVYQVHMKLTYLDSIMKQAVSVMK